MPYVPGGQPGGEPNLSISVIRPGVPTIVQVTVLTGQLTGSTPHWLGSTPMIVGRPDPSDPAGNGADASVDATNVTVTLDIAQALDITFSVMVMIPSPQVS